MIKLKKINLEELDFYFEKTKKILENKINEMKNSSPILNLIKNNLEKFLKNEITEDGKIKDLPDDFYVLKEDNCNILQSLFDYSNIIKSSKNNITLRDNILHKLNLKTCPYCDRQYISNYYNENNNEKSQAQIDHFYPKSIYPELALNINNFIPSCSYCNQLKSNNILKLNPRKEGFEDDAKFILTEKLDAILDMNLKNIKINIKVFNNSKKDKIESNIRTLNLREIYTMHNDYIFQLIKDVKFELNPYYLSTIEELFENSNDNNLKPFLKELILAPYKYKIKNNEPLGKLTKDILEFILIEE